jgi:putative drug exporter of the RND superfamily
VARQFARLACRSNSGASTRVCERALPGARIASFGSTGDSTFLSRDRRTIFALVSPRPDPDAQFGENPIAARAARRALRGVEVAGRPVHLTGFDALATDGGGGSSSPGLLLEAVIGGAGALLVLAFVFGSLLAVVPIVMAVASILTSFLLLLGLAQLTDISPIVEFVVALIGLGVAIDYSLLLVSRWGEERAHGYSDEQAVERALATAGRAMVVSGLTVAIGLLALIVLPIPFLRSLGYGGVLIPPRWPRRRTPTRRSPPPDSRPAS